MDARFNHNNKLIGKKEIMEYGERKGLLAREQFGSLNGTLSLMVVDRAMDMDQHCGHVLVVHFCTFFDVKAAEQNSIHP